MNIKRIVAFMCISIITVVMLTSCYSNIREVKSYEINANIESLYVFEEEYIVILGYANISTAYKGKAFYDYCKKRNQETLPASLELTMFKTGVVECKIIPIFETKGTTSDDNEVT